MEAIILVVEEWRDISGYSNYQVSTIGRVMNVKSGRVLKTTTHRGGYHQLTLSLNSNCTTYEVHRLVGLAFIPNPMNKPSVDHIDSNAKLNNTIENLRWATRTEQEANKPKQLNTSSNYIGVSWHRRENIWQSQIQTDRKHIHLGYFNSGEEAGLAYNKRASELFREFAKPNVIEKTQTQM